MGLEFNADKKYIKSDNVNIIGTDNFIIRSGSGSDEKEIFRGFIDPITKLPRIGVNRTGNKVDKITVTSQGSGYTSPPIVTIGLPSNVLGSAQAQASSILSNGRVIAVIVSNGGAGYSTAPSVSFQNSEGDTTGVGAIATSTLDTIEFEIDVNGAIRTSSSIISDTARILNLDLENFVTADLDIRAPYLKLFDNKSEQIWVASVSLVKDSFRYFEGNLYQAKNTGITGINPPIHSSGVVLNGTVNLEQVGFRVDDPNQPHYEQLSFPRSITPPLGDNTNKIATTEYVLNLATNDVGGRIYVSQQIGNDENDGRSVASPVRTIKRGCQLATESKNIKETVIVAGGDYSEDNPISIPPDCSVSGDSLRIVLVRPNNPGKHMFKFADKNYISGLTFRDKLDTNGNPVSTWDFACVFDDKQRLYYDSSYGGDFGRRFPIGHQIVGKSLFRAVFDFHSGGNLLVSGETINGVNTSAIGSVKTVSFTTTTGFTAYQKGTIDFETSVGVFAEGESVRYFVEAPVEYTGWPSSPSIGDVYVHPNDGISYSWNGFDWAREFSLTIVTLSSTRAEGEVVDRGTDTTTTLPISRIDASQQAEVGGIIFYTNALQGIENIHDFHEGQEVKISGLPTELANLNGIQRIYDLDDVGVLIDADSRSRRFVIPKDNMPGFTDSDYVPANASVTAFSYYVTVSLLNSPNKFEETPYISRRYQDARNLIKNNLEFIKDETYRQIIAEFPEFTNPNESKCRRDIGHFVSALLRDMEYGGNYNTIESAKYYVIGTGIGFIATELSETIRAFDIARNLAVLAMRGWRINENDDLYSPQFSSISRYFDPDVTIDSVWPYCANVESAINNLAYLFIAIISNNQVDRFVEASYLIARNQEFIKQETSRYIEDAYPQLFLSTNASAARYKDSTNLIRNNRQEIIDRAAAEIAVQHPDFYYPGDTQTNSLSRFKDSYRLIQLNRQQIIDTAFNEIAIVYPTFTNPNPDKCKRDIGHFIDAVSLDISLGGGNKYTRKFILQYFNNGTPISNGLVGEESQSITAFNKARDLMKSAITNQLTIKDLTITPDPITGSNTSTSSCANVQSAIDTLTNIVSTVVSAGNLTNLPAETTVQDLAGESKCKRDIGYIVDSVASDLYDGANINIINATKRYFLSATIPLLNGLVGETSQSITAFNMARDMMKKAVTNQLYYKDLTITGDPNPGSNPPPYGTEGVTTNNTTINSCSDVQNSITTLISIITTSISAGNLNSLPLINQGDFLTTTTIKCRRDIAFILGALRRDLILGGNAGIVSAGESYYTGAALTGLPPNELQPTREAFVKARDLSILAMRNWKTGNGTGVVYIPEFATAPQFIDSSTIVDVNTPTCANVATAILTSFSILDSILADGTVFVKSFGILFEPPILYPENTIYDADNKRVSIDAAYSDLPFIEASPYIQNASIISFLGGGGCEVDGDKIRQPNCPRPGLNAPVGINPPKATFPNQGKSMVAAQFTIVSFGGIGYKIINDGYTQLVSVFVLFAQDGIFADAGGYASVTNSATNFGTFALRAKGFSKQPYSFDVGTITNVTTTATGRTVFTVGGLGREPLEHYIVKFADYNNENPDIEYFIDAVRLTTVGPPFTSTLDLNEVILLVRKSNGQQITIGNAELVGKQIRLHRPSIVNSSSHTWEYAGAGNDYNALPENGGIKNEALEQVSQEYGRVYTSGTDELGDFKVGYFAKIENRTGNITFTGTVSISEVEFLKLKGGDVVVTGFDAANTLGGNFSSDSKIPTQKAVKDYISNNLGQYLNKPYSTNAVPRNLVELTDSGKISVDQLPALRPFNVFTVANEAERLALEGPLAGDIAIETETTTSYILNKDLESQYIGISVNTSLEFAEEAFITGSISIGQGKVTEYRQGVLFQINITNQGSGYSDLNPPSVSVSAPSQPGGVSAAASCTVVNGRIVTIKIIPNSGYLGGFGYTTQPTITISAPGVGGNQAEANGLIESRIYIDIINDIKIADTDTIQSTNTIPSTVSIIKTVNTSASNPDNWVSLSSSSISAQDITSGIISSSRLAGNAGEANSFTFLKGDSSYAPVVQSIKAAEKRYFAFTTDQTSIDQNVLQFRLNPNILTGHLIIAPGVPSGTTVANTFVTIVGNVSFTVVTLSTSVTQLITQNSIIQFNRPESPVLLSSPFTLSNFIDTILISSGGNGYNNGIYFDVQLLGGTGTGLKANITIEGGSIVFVLVTNGGVNYSSDFSIVALPPQLGLGTNAVLEVKQNTSIKNFADVGIDIKRVDEKTLSANLYGNTGVARFKKSQFDVGLSGDGSVDLKVGTGSGLDADLLDGAQGLFYRDGQNLINLSVSPDKLGSGLYGIDISGQSANTLRLTTSVSNPASSPSPSAFNVGVISDTRNNTADGLADGGNRHGVLTFRQFGVGPDASGGGVRQLAFTDNNNLYIRGSGSGVSSFSSWAKIWSSLNDGVGTGMDSDLLDGRQGIFYQNGYNINSGIVGTSHISPFLGQTSINNSLTIKSYIAQTFYDIYVSGKILSEAPFIAGLTIDLFDTVGIKVGDFELLNVTIFNSIDDTLDYSILTGRLLSGNISAAVRIGSTQTNELINDININDAGTFNVASLESVSGTARLNLGRTDGSSSVPIIDFRSSSSPASLYNVRLAVSGGNSANGSGTLNVLAANADSFTLNSNVIWNAGNITFSALNNPNTAVQRNASGNFAAGTITASLTGASSLNVLKSGDTITGDLGLINGSRITINTASGGLGSGSGNKTLTIFNDTAGRDAFLTFHVSGDYAGYFGLDGATNDLFWGGWSVGTSTKHTILHTGNNPVNNLNVINTLVKRDGSGNFSAGTITAALSGNATTATTLQNARTINGVSFSGSDNITITSSTAAALSLGTYLSYNAGTTFNGGTARTINVTASTSGNTNLVARNVSGDFSAGTITAALSGNATTATTATNLAGGAAGSVPYQSGSGTTIFLANSGAGRFIRSTASGIEWATFGIGGTNTQVQYNNSGALAGSAQFTFTSGTSSVLRLGAASSFRQNSTATWTGDAGASEGKLEYHSNRWYINAGSNSTEIVKFRRGATDVAWISNAGALSCVNDIIAFASDERLKTNIKPLENALDKVLSLSGFTYNFNEIGKSLGFDSTVDYVGVSAQQVQAVLPEAVKPAPANPDYITVQYEKIVPLLIEAIKELKEEINSLKNK